MGFALCGGLTDSLLATLKMGHYTVLAQGAAKPDALKNAEQQFKNTQTMKGIPAELLAPKMRFIAASLGVECHLCHGEQRATRRRRNTCGRWSKFLWIFSVDSR